MPAPERAAVSAQQLDQALLQWVQKHPDCAGIWLKGPIHRVEPSSPYEPTWKHSGEYGGRPVSSPRCDTAVAAIIEHLQDKYDLE
jgi:hypothetical protein